MAESPLTSLFGVWNKLQEKLYSTASSSVPSSCPFVLPELNQLNDMVYEVHCPPPEEKPELEIVFFHGLQMKYCNKAYYTTWLCRDNSHLWLTWLVDLFPKARILIIAYDSSLKKTDEVGRLDMYCTGENLVYSLTADGVRVGKAKCPVVLVGHCLGGLVLKELCLLAGGMVHRKSAERFGVARVRDFFSNLRGMFFYGTSHTGSLLCDRIQGCLSGELLKEIKTQEASSARRNQDFNDLKLKHGWRTCGVGESYETYVEFLGDSVLLVPEASCRQNMDTYYSAPADHYNVSKPEGKKSTSFLQLGDFLRKIQRDGVLRTREAVDAMCKREYVVGMERRQQDVYKILARTDNNMVFIVGLSGIGKTTLARRVFNQISHNFDITYFVSLDTVEGVSNSKEQLLRRLQHGIEGVNRISHHNLWSVINELKWEKVLMVLDNVESMDQLDALHTETWLEGTGSKLIVTTTNPRLGTLSNTFKVPYLNPEESEQLFHHYAFQGQGGPNDLSHLISEVVEECDNFPLSLKIVGGYVSSWEDVHNEHLWLNLVDRLKKAQEVDSGRDCRLWARLTLCYDALQPPEKEIFLDVATYFHGFQFSFVETIWKGSRESPHIAWMNLRKRFLADVDHRGTIWMHNQLRSLGQSIACPRSKPLHKWQRIPDTASAKELIANHQGIVDTLALKVQVTENERLTLRNTTFLKYVRLQYLILEGVKTSLGRVELPRSLVYLRWKDGFFTSCPVDFTRLEKLVVLELIDCKSMKSLSPGIVAASKLTRLELGGCLSLTKLPLGLSKCLEHLGLDRTGLRELPADLLKLQGIKQLEAGRTQLRKVPRGLGRLKMLSSLDLRGTGVTSLHESICDLKGLSHLDLSNTMLGSLPEKIGQLQNLSSLALSNTNVKMLPESVGALLNLRRLFIRDTPLETLPDSICNLRSLSSLLVRSPRLRELPKTIGMLSGLDAFEGPVCALRRNCTPSLELEDVGDEGDEGEQDGVAPRDDQSQMGVLPLPFVLPRLKSINSLILQGRDCEESWLQPLFCALREIPVILHLHLVDFNLVDIIPSELGRLSQVGRLCLARWERLRELPESLVDLRGLHGLRLEDLPRLCRLPEGFPRDLVSRGATLEIRRCGSLQNMQCPISHKSSSNGVSSDDPLLGNDGRVCYVQADSWRILECILECNKTHIVPVEVKYLAECKKMEMAVRRAMPKGSQDEGWDITIDRQGAVDVFNEFRLYFARRDDVLHEASRPPSSPSSHSSSGSPHQILSIECKDHCYEHPYNCVRVVDSNDEESSDIFIDENGEEEGSEAVIIQYLRAFWSFLLCSR